MELAGEVVRALVARRRLSVHGTEGLFAQYCGVRTRVHRVAQGQSATLSRTAAVDVSRHWAGLGNRIVTVNSLDRRHFGLIATNFEHHGPNISCRGYDRGFRNDVAGHLRGSACGFGRDLRDGHGHAAKSKSQPTRSLARLRFIYGRPIGPATLEVL